RMAEGKRGVAILGVFVADLAFRAGRMPGMGETIAGSGFKLGPGGKGSNQAVAAARVGAEVTFITKIGKDEFGAIASATWRREGVSAKVIESRDEPTGAAFIYVDDRSGKTRARDRPRSRSDDDLQSGTGGAVRRRPLFALRLPDAQ